MNVKFIPIKRHIVQAIFIAAFPAVVSAEVWRQFVAILRAFVIVKCVCLREELLGILLWPHGRVPLQSLLLLSLLLDSQFTSRNVARVVIERFSVLHRHRSAFAILALVLLLVDPTD